MHQLCSAGSVGEAAPPDHHATVADAKVVDRLHETQDSRAAVCLPTGLLGVGSADSLVTPGVVRYRTFYVRFDQQLCVTLARCAQGAKN